MSDHKHFSVSACALALVLVSQPVHAFRAEANVTVVGCSAPMGTTDGGTGVAFASASDEITGVCGPTPDDDATAIASGVADIAHRTVLATASAEGVVGGNRATGRGQFMDTLFIENVPAGVDSVQITASVDVFADSTGNFDFSNDFLFAEVSIAATGEIEIRQCTPAICPTSPIQTDSITQVFDVQRSTIDGQFPVILVTAEATIDLANGNGAFSAMVNAVVTDNSGATLASDSGVFGTGGGIDSDGDTIPDSVDNCTNVANQDQRDSNGDGYGNRCDADLDNNGIVNAVDLGLFKTVFFTSNADADFDGNGTVNAIDLGILKNGFFLPPGPSGLAP